MWKYAAIGSTLFLSSSIAVADASNWTYTPIGDRQAAIFFSMSDQEITSHLYKGKISFCESTEDFFAFRRNILILLFLRKIKIESRSGGGMELVLIQKN